MFSEIGMVGFVSDNLIYADRGRGEFCVTVSIIIYKITPSVYTLWCGA
jgi:hypothetical protein